MAIYISGVKGLPEQVQANKEDIEQIKEDIANIDFDAIRQLETQVGENTQDINNLENGQGVQDQAINGLGDRVGTAEGKITQLESDTRKITYNETDDETRIQGTTRIAVIKNNRIGDDDSIITFGTANGIELRQGNHILNYDNDGNLFLDGIQITPTPVSLPKYRHNIVLSYSVGGQFLNISLNYIDSNNTQATISNLYNYLYNSGFINNTKVQSVVGLEKYSSGDLHIINGMYATSNRFYLGWYDTSSSSYSFNYFTANTFTINDNVVEI